jgi:ABC-type polysaccharide/polyol phosphate export permease
MFKELFKKTKEVLNISFSFAKANFKLRNERSYLGILWYLIEPLSFLIILLILRGITSQGDIRFYPIYLFIGLVMYNFFMHVSSISTNIIQSKSRLIKNLTFPKESIVFSTPIQFLLSHLFEIIILIGFMIYFNIPVYRIILYPLVLINFLLFTTGVSFILATIGVFIDDLKNVWSVFLRILWFATPLFYSSPKEGIIYLINQINPLTYFIEISRQAIIFGDFVFFKFFIVLLASFIIFIIGLAFFNKYKSKFAEIV